MLIPAWLVQLWQEKLQELEMQYQIPEQPMKGAAGVPPADDLKNQPMMQERR